ncbi:MAG TPA: hypothetical protein PLJ35_20875 [Anaerolineae bacterium]|nr:hypothetical protein [Anaerolineae bacterium]HPL28632.1 hypothetical protein [Anaerolineae bacterium]
MTYVRFALSALAIIVGGILLAEFGDVIAVRTRLGRFLFGTILLATSTTLPELVAAFSAVGLGVPELAVGNLLGTCMTDMFFLGILDLASRRGPLLRQVAINHSLTASLATLLIGSASFFILVPLGLQIGTVDLEGLFLVAIFIGGMWLIQRRVRAMPSISEAQVPRRISLPVAIAGYAAATVLLVVAGPVLVSSAEAIAAQTGLAVGLIGVSLFPLITSMPELISSVVAVRIGAYDLAVGNLLGSCVLNASALGLVSLFFSGSLFSSVSPGFVAVGLLALILVNWALLGTLANFEWRPLNIEWDAAIIILIYLAGTYLLFRQGLLSAVR